MVYAHMVHGPWSIVKPIPITMVYRLWTMDYGLWTMDYGLSTMDYGLWSMVYGLSTNFPTFAQYGNSEWTIYQ
jgi:hypothetical protein